MNEILRIHIAGVAYDIDISAKRDLEKYLTNIKKSLGPDSDALEDIEIRITEILATRGVAKNDVITPQDLKAVRDQLGEPEDFASNPSDSSEPETPTTKPSKKFYRDEENAVLGGVIAGLAVYTGWDVTLLRILAVLLVVIPSFGTAIIAYIIIWICAPSAQTASEKLEMHGRPVNLESLKNSAKKFGEKAESTAEEALEKAKHHGKNISTQVKCRSKNLSHHAKNSTRTIGRILAIVLGIFGLMATFGLVIAISVITFILVQVIGSGIPEYHLLILSLSTATAFTTLLAILAVIISMALIIGRFGRATRISLVILSIFAALTFIAASVSSATWTTRAGVDGADYLRKHINRRF